MRLHRLHDTRAERWTVCFRHGKSGVGAIQVRFWECPIIWHVGSCRGRARHPHFNYGRLKCERGGRTREFVLGSRRASGRGPVQPPNPTPPSTSPARRNVPAVRLRCGTSSTSRRVWLLTRSLLQMRRPTSWGRLYRSRRWPARSERLVVVAPRPVLKAPFGHPERTILCLFSGVDR